MQHRLDAKNVLAGRESHATPRIFASSSKDPLTELVSQQPSLRRQPAFALAVFISWMSGQAPSFEQHKLVNLATCATFGLAWKNRTCQACSSDRQGGVSMQRGFHNMRFKKPFNLRAYCDVDHLSTHVEPAAVATSRTAACLGVHDTPS
jgi:hypothetical protein